LVCVKLVKKKKRGRKLSRKTNQRKALLRSLARALFLHEKIKTTEAKAKEVSRFAQKCITMAKKQNLAARRYLARYFSNQIVKKLVDDIAKKYKDRPGGYIRIVKLGPRKSDGARMAIIELVE
jgi:large subunit ribosomal protein L17